MYVVYIKRYESDEVNLFTYEASQKVLEVGWRKSLVEEGEKIINDLTVPVTVKI